MNIGLRQGEMSEMNWSDLVAPSRQSTVEHYMFPSARTVINPICSRPRDPSDLCESVPVGEFCPAFVCSIVACLTVTYPASLRHGVSDVAARPSPQTETSTIAPKEWEQNSSFTAPIIHPKRPSRFAFCLTYPLPSSSHS
jgi:hypothetical protein